MSVLTIILTIAISFLITVLLSPIIIPFLRRLKFGQSIREEGPKSHQAKSGTPTMGGVMIIVSIVLTTLIMIVKDGMSEFTSSTFILLFVLLGYGLIGFLDDFIKIKNKRNLGLTSKQKMLGQIIIAIIVFIILDRQGYNTEVALPGTALSIDFGWFYAVFLLLMLVGASNAVNLTDGLDGLVAGTASVAFAAFAVIGWYHQMPPDLIIFTLAVVGALLGFLVFNSHPAKVFMGDTGSLAFGASLAMVAILMKLEILLVLIGGVFVIETLSVIIQVISFKTTGKRVFKMSPLHHHYELIGWSEWKVVTSFWLVGILCAALGILIEVGI
ncbi:MULTISPECIES: phospho-N-acetylmuramoyl-pentapeptide-transferase [Allobacillus]|uniref:Phospho-N-acetylmuramoyl-pentapeptide-transferase n=1 Tax=Allobacillus halotolerans TaxID=570278 RepID=A0ABS6GMW4_9BACI|nr:MULTISPECIES: phospho-N-acetylmuramoyl-pentapeptide-transferase [Allobacillus]MBU6080457.1 phospho-N-acetylmuramoyl-pentapeptide-transferase [Allobacillus halotolerans]TSJ69310.1 phospho-N-acetylmuramoyl-pentapeptide-transferase [Allobacillus sp. SKP2-8]